MPGGNGRLSKDGHRQIFERLFIARAPIATTNCCSGATLPMAEGSFNWGLQEDVSSGASAPR